VSRVNGMLEQFSGRMSRLHKAAFSSMCRPMSTLPVRLPDRATERHLHQRLLAGERTASSDIATTYLAALVNWLTRQNREVDSSLVEQAADEALLSLICDPSIYDPAKKTLFGYLRMAASGDLKNLIRKEMKHQIGRKSLKSVELSPHAGKYLGREEDPSFASAVRDEQKAAKEQVEASMRDGWTEFEARVWQLMRSGERRTAVYAKEMGIAHLPFPEQKKEVKRMKERLQKRHDRAGDGP
jgi:hypothetical protein